MVGFDDLLFIFWTLQANSNHSMLGVHASAQAIIHFGKIARKHGLTGVCLDSLSRLGNVIYPFGIVIYPMKMLFTLSYENGINAFETFL